MGCTNFAEVKALRSSALHRLSGVSCFAASEMGLGKHEQRWLQKGQTSQCLSRRSHTLRMLCALAAATEQR